MNLRTSDIFEIEAVPVPSERVVDVIRRSHTSLRRGSARAELWLALFFAAVCALGVWYAASSLLARWQLC